MNERTNEQSRTNGIDSAEEQHSPQREATAEQNTPPAAPQTISDDLSGEGRLLVRVTTATGAIPLEYATVPRQAEASSHHFAPTAADLHR